MDMQSSLNLEALGELVVRFWWATLGGFLLLVAVALYVLAYQPKLSEQARLEKDILRARQELELSRQRLQEPAPATATAPRPWKETEALLLTRIPPGQDLPGFVDELLQLLAESAITRASFPSIEEVKGPPGASQAQAAPRFGSFLLKLTLRTTYPELIQLLESLERLTRLVEIESLRLSGDTSGLLSELVLRVYHGK